jgi:hypothetical protein
MIGIVPDKISKNSLNQTASPIRPNTAATAPPINVFIKPLPPLQIFDFEMTTYT